MLHLSYCFTFAFTINRFVSIVSSFVHLESFVDFELNDFFFPSVFCLNPKKKCALIVNLSLGVSLCALICVNMRVSSFVFRCFNVCCCFAVSMRLQRACLPVRGHRTNTMNVDIGKSFVSVQRSSVMFCSELLSFIVRDRLMARLL